MNVPDSFTILGITFHVYGFIVGLSLIMLWKISERILIEKISKNSQSTLFFWMIISALMGARAWHVFTQWDLYIDDPITGFYIWQGGLSIFGAILGGIIGIVSASKVHKLDRYEVLHFADAMAIALPFAQATGRLANWLNEELYGPPTNLPWKIYISEQNRLEGFENHDFFHPLFLYESFGNIFLGFLLAFLEKKTHLQFGQGKILLLYLIGYGFLRFFLDFMRIDKTMLYETNIGLNQFLIFVSINLLITFWVIRWFSIKKLIFCILFLFISSVSLGIYINSEMDNEGADKQNIEIANLTVDGSVLKVEIADDEKEITRGLSGRNEIGADGMLFILGQKRIPGFWMIDMKFDLDIIWISDNKIVAIEKNVKAPAENTPNYMLTIYRPPAPVDMVLEVPAGLSDRKGWKSRDEVKLMLL